MRTLRRIIIHHSASPLTTTLADITNWHVARGFDGVGYHFVIDSKGIVHPGRPVELKGAHAKGANSDSIGICVVGNNTSEDDRWGPLQVAALGDLTHALAEQYGKLDLQAHQWAVGCTTQTECPGLTPDQWNTLKEIL